jgi:hypothetical protein
MAFGWWRHRPIPVAGGKMRWWSRSRGTKKRCESHFGCWHEEGLAGGASPWWWQMEVADRNAGLDKGSGKLPKQSRKCVVIVGFSRRCNKLGSVAGCGGRR